MKIGKIRFNDFNFESKFFKNEQITYREKETKERKQKQVEAVK